MALANEGRQVVYVCTDEYHLRYVTAMLFAFGLVTQSRRRTANRYHTAANGNLKLVNVHAYQRDKLHTDWVHIGDHAIEENGYSHYLLRKDEARAQMGLEPLISGS